MFAVALLLSLMVAVASAHDANDTKPYLILFGSCQHQDLRDYAAPVWASMSAHRADELLLLGDVIYGDHRVVLSWSRPTNESEMRRRYGLIRNDARWNALLASTSRGRAIGTWDDHGAQTCSPCSWWLIARRLRCQWW